MRDKEGDECKRCRMDEYSAKKRVVRSLMNMILHVQCIVRTNSYLPYLTSVQIVQFAVAPYEPHIVSEFRVLKVEDRMGNGCKSHEKGCKWGDIREGR